MWTILAGTRHNDASGMVGLISLAISIALAAMDGLFISQRVSFAIVTALFVLPCMIGKLKS